MFARDPDAQLDMIELELSEDIRNWVAERGATAWRMESSLREFENFRPVNFWFEYPIHRLDTENLQEMPTQGSPEAGRLNNPRCKSANEANDEFRNAFKVLSLGRKAIPIEDIAEYLELSTKTIYGRVSRLKQEFKIEKGQVVMLETVEK